ncbi:hypothetical protein [Lactobacillus juensis]|uniref:hypothetical protein n=1 Tax=Lactobacillus juensis TaxID=3082862 RepID=UPI0030C67584
MFYCFEKLYKNLTELGDAYVRASDVKYGYGIKLKPSKTKAEVEVQAKSAANN